MERPSEIRNEELIWWLRSRCDTERESMANLKTGHLKLTKDIGISKRYMNPHVR